MPICPIGHLRRVKYCPRNIYFLRKQAPGIKIYLRHHNYIITRYLIFARIARYVLMISLWHLFHDIIIIIYVLYSIWK